MDPGLDRRLGWRWLAPMAPPTTTRLIGFDAGEAAVLLGDVFDRGAAVPPRTLWIVDADADGAAAMAQAAGLEHPDVLIVIGGARNLRPWRACLERYREHRSYGLLPAAAPRVVVPLRSTRATRQALRLHRPGRGPRRLAVQLATLLAALGLARPLFGRRLHIATHTASDFAPRELGPAGLPAAVGGGDDFALYLGTADADRRTVVLPLGATAPRQIVKLATTPAAMTALAREAETLAALATTPVADRIPRVLRCCRGERRAALHLEYRPRRWTPPWRHRRRVVDFLAALARLDATDIAVGDWLAATGLATATLAPEALRLREALAAAVMPLRLHRAHGDFTPWNCADTAAGLFVFDWDSSVAHGPALADAANYVLAPAILVCGPAGDGLRAQIVARRALRLAAAVAEHIDLPPARVAVQVGAALLLPDPRLDGPLRRRLQSLFAALLSERAPAFTMCRPSPRHTAAAAVRP